MAIEDVRKQTMRDIEYPLGLTYLSKYFESTPRMSVDTFRELLVKDGYLFAMNPWFGKTEISIADMRKRTNGDIPDNQTIHFNVFNGAKSTSHEHAVVSMTIDQLPELFMKGPHTNSESNELKTKILDEFSKRDALLEQIKLVNRRVELKYWQFNAMTNQLEFHAGFDGDLVTFERRWTIDELREQIFGK